MRWEPIPGLSLFGTFSTSFALNGRLGSWGCGHTLAIKQMTGRYQGYHYFPSKIGSIEIYRRADGWWWRSRSSGRPPEGAPVGPFITSTEAYLNASGGALPNAVPQ
jgi:hypothetical protein